MPHASKAADAGRVLTPLTCPLLSAQHGIAHGFFTRNGGASSGIYASLNCGPGSGDDMEKVLQNRMLVAQTLGTKQLLTAYQIHSAQAIIVEKPWAVTDAPQADALVTNIPGIAIGILTADCVPVLFSDSKKRVIAAAHAGWKGAIAGIIESTLAAMEKLGAERANIRASIGPAIAQGSYEVGMEFHDRFLADDKGNAIYFIHGGRPAHFLFDLKAYVKDRLRGAGALHINMLAPDTCLQEDDFFSFRRATLRGEPAYGRQVSAIALHE